jgi:hypothetical protein
VFYALADRHVSDMLADMAVHVAEDHVAEDHADD